jgi:rhodanese-related sulfurtransferase
VTGSQLPSVSVREVGAGGGGKDRVLLDVREDDEWAEGHAPQAQHLPMSQLVARLGELPREQPLDVVCHLGGRSAQVTAYLLQQGYDARNVDGGMDAWERAGLPVVRDGGGAGEA